MLDGKLVCENGFYYVQAGHIKIDIDGDILELLTKEATEVANEYKAMLT
jgi:hypothetical protein